MIKDYFVLALKSLVHKKVRSWLTLLGIFIGVAAVVSLIGLGEGLRTAITSQFGVSSTEVLTVQAGGLSGAGPPGTGVTNPITFDDAKAIERISSVEAAIPRMLKYGSFEYKDKFGFGMAASMPSGDDRKLVHELLDVGAEDGRMLKDGDNTKVLLGYNFFSGEAMGRKIKTGENVLINGKKFTVVGFTEKKGSFIFDNVVWMNEEPMKDLFDIEDEVAVIAVKVKSSDLMYDAKEDIEKLLRKTRDVKVGEEDFAVQTPDASLESLDSVLKGVQVFVVLIAFISIIIGSIGIVNTMLTSVMERKSEIGIMKSLGSKNSDIFYVFFFESGLMGLIGGIVGVTIGTAVSYMGTIGINNWVNASSHPQVNLALVFGTLFGSFVIGSLSGIVPALKAAKLNPVDALRG